MTRGGLPHSEIPGSKLICSSPGLIAACHVLHRLLAPRHSPYTLSSLTIRNSELTITGWLHTSRSASVLCNTACGLPSAAAANGTRVLWSEKTTVCRIFNCQRSSLGVSPQTPAHSLAGPDAPLRALAKRLFLATLKSRKTEYVLAWSVRH